MLKKLGAILILLSLLAPGCSAREAAVAGPEPEAEPAAPGKYEFRLNSLPELEVFNPFSEISARYYNAYMDHLLPQADYGMLYPFIGAIVGSANEFGVQPYYGLCDGEGRIVVDAVFTSYYQWEGADGLRLYVLAGKPHPYQPEGEGGDYTGYYNLYTICPPDGAWAIRDVNGYLYAADSQAIIINGNYLDWNSAYTTNYIYTPEGKLRATLPESSISAYHNGYLVLGEPGADGETAYRMIDLDGNTVTQEAARIAALQQGNRATLDENGLWGLVDEAGQFIDDQRYVSLSSDYGEAGLYHFVSADNQYTGILDENGQTLWQMAADSGWFNLTIDRYTQEKVLTVYNSLTNSRYLQNLDSGEQSAVWETDEHWLDYLGNGWYYDIQSKDRRADKTLTLLRWGEAEPVYTLPEAEGVYLEDADGDIAVVSYYSEESAARGDGYSVAFIRLSDGQELIRLYGYVYAGYEEGLGYLLSDTQDWRIGAFDHLGNKLLPGSYFNLAPVGGGWYQVYDDIYAGLINGEGQWLIRFCVNDTD